MGLKLVFAAALLVTSFSTLAVAGPVYLSLVLNPPTDADAGGTLDGTSTESGPGTWHLYAFDDTTGSSGIAGYSITMTGINTVFNRTPSTFFDPDGNGDQEAGFRFLRSINDTTPPLGGTSNPITGAQPLTGSTSINPILGFGRAASDFASKLPPGSTLSTTTSPSWGDYATDPLTPFQLTGLFVAEGTYSAGQIPFITAAQFLVYNNAQTFSIIETDECLNAQFGGDFVSCRSGPPEIVVSGNDRTINDGDTTPSLLDSTDFGIAELGSSQMRTFNIRNFGEAPLQLGNPVLTGPFSIAGQFPTAIAGNLNQIFRVALDTSTPGKYQGSISFTNNDSNENPFNFALSAEVIPEPTAIPLFVVGISACTVSCRPPRKWMIRTL
jgi:hypothetical protein